MTRKQVEPDNNTGELDNDFGIVPSISEVRVALKTREKLYYTLYEDTDAERKSVVFMADNKYFI